MFQKRLLTGILALCLLVVFAACGAASNPPAGGTANPSTAGADAGTDSPADTDSPAPPADARVLQLGHVNPSDPDDQYNYWCLRMNELLMQPEYGGGAIQLEIFSDSSLGNETELFSGVSDGSMDSAIVSNNIISGSVTEMQIFDLPYMFDSEDEYQFLADNPEFIQPLIDHFRDEYDIHIFGPVLDASWRTLFTSKKPVQSLEDMKDLKVRVTTNRVHEAAFKALGTIPSVIAWNECYTAFQQGVIDGLDAGIPVSATMGFYRVSSYCTKDNPFPIMGWPMMSNTLWNSMSAEEQGWLTEAAKVASADQRAHQRQMEKEFQTMMEGEGITFYEPDLAPFKEATRPVHEQFRDEIGSDLLDKAYQLLDDYRAG